MFALLAEKFLYSAPLTYDTSCPLSRRGDQVFSCKNLGRELLHGIR